MQNTPKRRVAVVGSTGSIGTQTLDVLRRMADQFTVTVLAAGNNTTLLASQAAEFAPRTAIMAQGADTQLLQQLEGLTVHTGQQALLDAVAADDVDDVLVAVSGFNGLAVSLAAARAGKRILLANKETLVCGGQWFLQTAANNNAQVLPVDSEHSAIFQCLQGQPAPKSLVLTASGGPFYGYTLQQLQQVTFAQAMRHPTWEMGWKITLDSATLLNKGLELIEACHLFSLPPQDIEIVVHPQSIIHSAVVFEDNSMIAQLGWPDMRLPIQYALTYPQRCPSPCRPLHLAELKQMTFGLPDEQAFACLPLARTAMQMGGTAPTAYNAAGEQAAAAFRAGQINFLQIGQLIAQVLEQVEVLDLDAESIYQTDAQARRLADEWITRQPVG